MTSPSKNGPSHAAEKVRLPTCFGPQAVLLVGNLKVGKSSLFSMLTGGREHLVSYPGSDMELSWGNSGVRTIIDTPGIYSLQDHSEDAGVIRRLLLEEGVGAALLVLDAKNLRRGLTLALQLAELEVPLVVALNMSDEARQRGVHVDADALALLLGAPVVSTVANEGRGVGQLRRALADAAPASLDYQYPASQQGRLEQLRELLGDTDGARGLAYLLLADTIEAREVAAARVPANADALLALATPKRNADPSPNIALTEAEQVQADALARGVSTLRQAPRAVWMDRLSVWTREPMTGVPIALAVLAVAYLFIGYVGATVLVDLLEGKLFGELLLPALDRWVALIPWAWVRDLLTGEFGLISVGVVLSVGIVTPVLATFFFAFAVLEDSGYLPRLSLLMDRMLRVIGLNGKGVLPLLMGFSCITMAVLTTRMLDTRKQRIIATLLLVLTFPCAPLLSVMLVMLGRLSWPATLVVFAVLGLQLVLVGYLSKVMLPGRRSDFIMELPPLRAPSLRNVLFKSGHRLLWFLREAIPYFILGTFGLFLLEQAGMLTGFREALRPVAESLLGLPSQSADVFLLTILRREAGAALLAKQAAAGLYDGVQVVVTIIVMTLMIPCFNTVLIMYKERGALTASLMLAFVIVYSLVVGGIVNAVCQAVGAQF